MRVSLKGQYALTIMKDLAKYGRAECVKTKDISKRTGVSIKFLEQIIGLLGKAKLVKAERGRFGGYKLTRKPSEYTAGEILRASEGALEPVSGLEERDSGIDNFNFWNGLYIRINEYVDSLTLDKLSDMDITDNFDYYI